MKQFWQKPSKKKKRKPKAAPQKQNHQAHPKPKPAPWVPPHPTKPKTPVVEDKLHIEAPVTYQIPTAPHNFEKTPISLPPSPEREVFRPKEQQARKEFLKTFRSLTSRWRSWDVWVDFVTMAACAISNSVDKLHYNERENTYLRIIKKYSKEEQKLFPELFAHLVMALEENPEQDFLGDIYTELGLNSRERQQIFTPYSVCRMMAEITFDDLVSQVEEKGVVEIHDCCCGAGATLIAAANVAKSKLENANLNFQNHLLITGQDIDYVVTMMCYIQISLLGVAGYFKVGNSLTEPMTDGDSLENYWFTPMYFFPIWTLRRIWRNVDQLTEGGTADGKS